MSSPIDRALQVIRDRDQALRAQVDWREYNYVCTGMNNCLAEVVDPPDTHRAVVADFIRRVDWGKTTTTHVVHGCVAVNYDQSKGWLKRRVRSEGLETRYVHIEMRTKNYDSDLRVLVRLMKDGRSWRSTAGYSTPMWGSADQFAEACAEFLSK